MLGDTKLRQTVLIAKSDLLTELYEGIVNKETLLNSLRSFLTFKTYSNLTEEEKDFVAFEYLTYLYQGNVTDPEAIKSYVKDLYEYLEIDCNLELYVNACCALTLVQRGLPGNFEYLYEIIRNDQILLIDNLNRKMMLMSSIERIMDRENKDMELLAKATKLLKEII